MGDVELRDGRGPEDRTFIAASNRSCNTKGDLPGPVAPDIFFHEKWIQNRGVEPRWRATVACMSQKSSYRPQLVMVFGVLLSSTLSSVLSFGRRLSLSHAFPCLEGCDSAVSLSE